MWVILWKQEKIKASLITEKVKKLFMDCNYFIGNEHLQRITKSQRN